MFETPILFLIFNRPDTTKLVFEKIREIQPKYLYIAADGPREEKVDEVEVCKKTRKMVLDSIDWDCELKILFQEANLGCGRGPATAIKWFFENVEQGIILEDDCLPDLSFFNYCEVLLDKFKFDEKIIAINGCNFGFNTSDNVSYIFARYMNAWGWASWRTRLSKIDYELKKWQIEKAKLFFIYSRLKYSIFDLDIDWYKHWINIFDNLIYHYKDVWDYHWIYSQFFHKKWNIVPTSNLITNIGFLPDATHTTLFDHPAANLPIKKLNFPIVHPPTKKINKLYEDVFVKKTCYMYNRKPAIFYLKKFLSRFWFYKLLKKIIK